jgi:hypothetical protein
LKTFDVGLDDERLETTYSILLSKGFREHHLHSHAARLSLLGGNQGVGQPQISFLSDIENHGRRFLHRRSKRGLGI